MHEIDEKEKDRKAIEAKEKKAAYGEDIDLDSYCITGECHEPLDTLEQLPEEDKAIMLKAGVDATEQDRSGSYVQKDISAVYATSLMDGLEVLPIKEALKIGWINEYYWKLVPVDQDKFTSRAYTDLHNGYVIRSLPGAKVNFPVQACLYLHQDALSQNMHNIIIAEEDSELHVITGCVSGTHVVKGLHVGISEFYVKKNAKLSFTMIHHWAQGMVVRPRSVGVVEEGGLFLNNYVSMKPVKSLQMYPATRLAGRGAVARFYSLLVGHPGSKLDVGGRILLNAPETRAEIIARAISNGGTIISRGHLAGDVPGVKAHLECRGLILNGGDILAIPELHGKVDGVDMSHEAAVGKINQDEILYLMSRGLSEDEATATIVRGFMSVDIPGLPPDLKSQIDAAVAQTNQEVL
ncbi:MAG TPA: SufD family Fe-S cluster assembly protein [Deltaproteobacteria bacterium]|jgi:Fe-S cluster assembly scaffold protein SufB|nr:SufD family Fe-S cluster assembly protein [Deltaproteobacteria bacterium]HRR22527.1 SufD family Fe-S cluster assembly protein [Desulfomonilia bacterium]